jgi:DNA-binding transcriptional ArsR family regulator
MADDIIVLEPGDERAQKIGRAISSQTANDILQLISDEPRTASELTDTLHIPMSTIKYHLDNLLSAGLLEVTETRYSVKGREIKVYAVRNQLVIVAPKLANLRSILLKYASLFGVVILATLVMLAVLPLFHAPPVSMGAPSFSQDGNGGAGAMETLSAEKSPGPAPSAAPMRAAPSAAPALAFFAGGCLIIVILLIIEVYRWQKARGRTGGTPPPPPESPPSDRGSGMAGKE